MKWKDWDRNLKIRLYGEGVMNLLFWTFFPFMAIFFAETLGKEMAGLLLIASQLISVAVGLAGGYCADRFGRKRMMVVSAFGEGAAFLVFAFANSPWYDSPVLTFIAFSVLGLCGALYWPASHAMVADVVPEKHRSTVFAVFYTSINISVVIGPIIGGIFFFEYRYGLLLVCAAVSLVLALVIKKYISETAPAWHREQTEDTSGSTKWYRHIGRQLQDYRVIAKDKSFLLFIIAGILVAQTFMQLDLLIAVYTNEVVPAQTLFSAGNWQLELEGQKIFGLIVAENGLLVALFTVLMAKWMTRYTERNVFVLSSLLYGIGIMLFGSTINVWVLFVAMGIFTFAELMVVGIQESFVSKLSPEHMRGQYFAASSLRFTIGRAIAPVSIPMTVWFGYTWTFATLCGFAVISALLYIVMFSMIEKNKPVNPVVPAR